MALVLWGFGALMLRSAFSRQQPAATCGLQPADRKIHALMLWCFGAALAGIGFPAMTVESIPFAIFHTGPGT